MLVALLAGGLGALLVDGAVGRAVRGHALVEVVLQAAHVVEGNGRLGHRPEVVAHGGAARGDEPEDEDASQRKGGTTHVGR